MTDYTADQIAERVVSAIHYGEFEVVNGLLRLLAAKDPHRAADFLDAIELGLKISREREAS